MSLCPCCSGQEFKNCCQPYIEGASFAPTAEALMRARFSAHSLGLYDFLRTSTSDKARDEVNWDELKKWSSSVTWEGLEILNTTNGNEHDEEGSVQFIARFSFENMGQEHKETSFFGRDENKHWIYLDGEMENKEPLRREGPKIGRNDPCPCGSGKKYKKCCMEN